MNPTETEPNPFQHGDRVTYHIGESDAVRYGYYSMRSGKTDYVYPFHSYGTHMLYEVRAVRIVKI